jgi:hypothetical protein
MTGVELKFLMQNDFRVIILLIYIVLKNEIPASNSRNVKQG